VSCEHLGRRVVRHELDGSDTVIADNYNGKRLNSPNDVVPHPDGSLWFTDPPYGGQLYEGAPDGAGGPSNQSGHLNPKLGQPAGFVPGKREQPTNCYRGDPSGKLDLVVTEEQVQDPNGLCFSPDYKKLYVISTGKVPEIRELEVKAKSPSLTSAPTTSSRTRSYLPIAWSMV
jgi:gluconolactonase